MSKIIMPDYIQVFNSDNWLVFEVGYLETTKIIPVAFI